jgi:hypothetical protein
MNIYDPADYIVYVVLDADPGSGPARDSSRPAETCLPCGYANESPRTSLRARRSTTGRVRPSITAVS